MQKAIFLKEWIKTRRVFWGISAMSLCFVVYALLRVERVMEFKGAAHLWEILLMKDVVFIEALRYVPLGMGLLLGIAQFVPEVVQKRLKLTLHLPYPRQRMIVSMLLTGGVLLLGLFILHYVVLGLYLANSLAPELYGRILLTALPWYLAGLAAYLLTAWVCLEPVWWRRGVDALVAAGVLRIFFISETPEAYHFFLVALLVWMVGFTGFSLLSVDRFKRGEE